MPIALDLDGTLFDTSEREAKCKKNGKMDWDCWFNPINLMLDKPNEDVLNLVKSLNEAVYIISGRIRELQNEATIAQLTGLGLNIQGIYLKPKAWQFIKEHAYKAWILIHLSTHGVLVNHIIDDNPKVLDTAYAALEEFSQPRPRLWLVRDGRPVEYKAQSRPIGWIGLVADKNGLKAGCPVEHVLRIVRNNDEYYALCIDNGVELRPTGIDVLTATVNGRNWISPIAWAPG